jgi:hypothetical protein
MLKTGDSKKWLGIMLVVLAVIVVGITATGYADPNEQLSGPAVVGTLTVSSSDSMFAVTFDGNCRGKAASKAFSGASVVTLPDAIPNLAAITAPKLLEGLRIQWPVQVSTECPLQNLIVKAVMPSKFMPITNGIMADVVLLFVVP